MSAHYDHLGVRGGVLYPGADDNASGVAMMLEVARSLTAAPDPPRRSLMFIGFDLEEVGLFGSRYFVAHPPVPLEQVVLFITADMIGRALGRGLREPRLRPGNRTRPGPSPLDRPGGQGPALDRSACWVRTCWFSTAAITGRSAAGRFPTCSSAPARTRAIIHRKTGRKRSITRS